MFFRSVLFSSLGILPFRGTESCNLDSNRVWQMEKILKLYEVRKSKKV
jgi:hypothetical protein